MSDKWEHVRLQRVRVKPLLWEEDNWDKAASSSCAKKAESKDREVLQKTDSQCLSLGRLGLSISHLSHAPKSQSVPHPPKPPEDMQLLPSSGAGARGRDRKPGSCPAQLPQPLSSPAESPGPQPATSFPSETTLPPQAGTAQSLPLPLRGGTARKSVPCQRQAGPTDSGWPTACPAS